MHDLRVTLTCGDSRNVSTLLAPAAVQIEVSDSPGSRKRREEFSESKNGCHGDRRKQEVDIVDLDVGLFWKASDCKLALRLIEKVRLRG